MDTGGQKTHARSKNTGKTRLSIKMDDVPPLPPTDKNYPGYQCCHLVHFEPEWRGPADTTTRLSVLLLIGLCWNKNNFLFYSLNYGQHFSKIQQTLEWNGCRTCRDADWGPIWSGPSYWKLIFEPIFIASNNNLNRLYGEIQNEPKWQKLWEKIWRWLFTLVHAQSIKSNSLFVVKGFSGLAVSPISIRSTIISRQRQKPRGGGGLNWSHTGKLRINQKCWNAEHMESGQRKEKETKAAFRKALSLWTLKVSRESEGADVRPGDSTQDSLWTSGGGGGVDDTSQTRQTQKWMSKPAKWMICQGERVKAPQ